MAYTIHTQPNKYTGAYSAIPLRVNSTDVITRNNFKYLINIGYDKMSKDTTSTFVYGNDVYTQVSFVDNHNFNIGDTVHFNNGASKYTGTYNIVAIPNVSAIVIDMILDQPIFNNVDVMKTINYKMSPDLELEAKLDLSNTIKDFVSGHFEDTNIIYDGSDTKLTYDLEFGQESEFIFKFEDNTIYDSDVAFYNSTDYTEFDIPKLPFKVGDKINIQQELYKWDMDFVYIDLGELSFRNTSMIPHNLKVGDTINVFGNTNNDYNGYTSVRRVISPYEISTWKTFGTTSFAPSGKIYATIRPNYNTVATITSMRWDAGLAGGSIVIGTDIGWDGSSPVLPGKITFADGRLTREYTNNTLRELMAYNGYFNTHDYTMDAFDKYVIQDRVSSLNNFSTILETGNRYRIERSAKNFLLAHHELGNASSGSLYKFYNSSGTLLNESFMYNNIDNYIDYYVPVGLEQLAGSPDLQLTSGTALASILDDVVYYDVYLFKGGDLTTNSIRYYINTDCSKFDTYQLIWKDKFGSYISYPFKYLAIKESDFERKEFRKTQGNWNLTDNTFGYKSTDRGNETYFSRSVDKISLNSGWVDTKENFLIKDLLQSTDVFIQIPNDDVLSVNIQTNKVIYGDDVNGELFQYNIDVLYSSLENRF